VRSIIRRGKVENVASTTPLELARDPPLDVTREKTSRAIADPPSRHEILRLQARSRKASGKNEYDQVIGFGERLMISKLVRQSCASPTRLSDGFRRT
jgi:hypothetical protein